KDFLFKFTGDGIEARNILGPNGIKLSRLAAWLIKAKDIGVDDEKLAQGLSLCLAGLIFFPNRDDIQDEEHLGTIQSSWQKKSMAQAILAYLYGGLSSACL